MYNKPVHRDGAAARNIEMRNIIEAQFPFVRSKKNNTVKHAIWTNEDYNSNDKTEKVKNNT